MASNLFVAGIPFAYKDEELQKHFEEAGTVVSAKIITDRDSGRSKGYGFVEMATEEEAKKAIEMFNNSTLGERTIIVKEARPKEERPERRDRDNRSQGGGNRW